jgi:hypothetical protein
LDLTFLRLTRGNAGRNVKSATLAPAHVFMLLERKYSACGPNVNWPGLIAA